MLAPENCRLIVGRGSGAHYSVLSGKKHQGRTARRAGEPLYRTAVGERCRLEYTAFGTLQRLFRPLVNGLSQNVPWRVGLIYTLLAMIARKA